MATALDEAPSAYGNLVDHSQVGAGRLGVRVRAGRNPADVVLAFPWVHRTRGRVAGEQIAVLLGALTDRTRSVDEIFDEAASAIIAAPDGPGPSVITPTVPVASVTGTNGKTTTTRLMAHMCMTAGLTTAWSSTDGVVVMAEPFTFDKSNVAEYAKVF